MHKHSYASESMTFSEEPDSKRANVYKSRQTLVNTQIHRFWGKYKSFKSKEE